MPERALHRISYETSMQPIFWRKEERSKSYSKSSGRQILRPPKNTADASIYPTRSSALTSILPRPIPAAWHTTELTNPCPVQPSTHRDTAYKEGHTWRKARKQLPMSGFAWSNQRARRTEEEESH